MMAPIERLKSPVAEAIERHYRDAEQPRDSANISAGKLGEECERAIWYSFRWASPVERFDGRMVRLFQTGHREEARMIADLRAIGCEVHSVNEATGAQFEIWIGPIHGYADGKVLGVPGAEKTWHVLECKTHNDKSFNEWRRLGVEKSKPVHYAQMQLYMHGFGLTRALYMAHNKNTDEVETERVKIDPLAVEQLLAKADRIVHANEPPPKVETWKCRSCRHEGLCRYDDWPRMNCRTCIHASYAGGEWGCVLKMIDLDIPAQKAGCAEHLYIPAIVPGEQIDADEENYTVTYMLRVEAREWIDGRDEKPKVPEVQA